MNDRVMVYDGALPQTTDILQTNLFAMIGKAFGDQAMLGSSTLVAGLACTPTTPTASLQVNIGTGSIFAIDPVDATAYADLGTNSANILKQGILQATQTLTLTSPSTTGFSQVYLIEVALEDIDNGAAVLSFFNSANPAAPFSGPANAGTSNFTVRSCQAVVSMVAGTPASTGTQTTPTTTAGFTPLYTITLVNGQTQITSGNIVQLLSAPFFPTLPSVPLNDLLNTWRWGVDSGSANAFNVKLTPTAQQASAYQLGMGIKFKANASITGASTINVTYGGTALGSVAVHKAGGGATVSGDIVAGQIVSLVFDGTAFQMENYTGATSGSVTNNFNTANIPYAADTGTTNALVASYSSITSSSQIVAGLYVAIKLANAITGACTLNINSYGTKNVLLGNLATPTSGVFVAGEILLLVFDGTQWQIESTGTSVAGPAGPPGPTGTTGATGTISLSPGGIGTYALGAVQFGQGGTPVPPVIVYDAFGNAYPGTWQVVSNMQEIATGYAALGLNYNTALCQRIA